MATLEKALTAKAIETKTVTLAPAIKGRAIPAGIAVTKSVAVPTIIRSVPLATSATAATTAATAAAAGSTESVIYSGSSGGGGVVTPVATTVAAGVTETANTIPWGTIAIIAGVIAAGIGAYFLLKK